jgi:hypothetical protein
MPLLFPSLSHGEIAFGFFNIETDMLLLNHYFFFASNFCRYVSEMASLKQTEMYSADWEIYPLEEQHIGSVMGAIRRVDLRGFIGEVYIRYPFPEDMNHFKQNPDGYQTQQEMKEIIAKYGMPEVINCFVDTRGNALNIGEFRFSSSQFHRLIRYVWEGGYPRWKDDSRPDYVEVMAQNVTRSSYPLFTTLCELV